MKRFFALALMAVLSGCATKPTVPSANALLLSAGTLDDTALMTADGLMKAGTITPAQLLSVLSVTDAVHTALSAASLATDSVTTSDKLLKISGIVASLTACLKPPITAATFDACLTAIPVGDL